MVAGSLLVGGTYLVETIETNAIKASTKAIIRISFLRKENTIGFT